MADIKKLIDDYDSIINRKQAIVTNYESKIDECNNKVNGLLAAIELVKDETAIKVLSSEITNITNVRENYILFLEEAVADGNSVFNSRKVFMEVIRMNCDHDWIFDFTDGHNGDDNYHCSICNAYRN